MGMIAALTDKVKKAEANPTPEPKPTAMEVAPIEVNPVNPLVEPEPKKRAPSSRQSFYQMVQQYGKPYDYEKEVREAERQRKAGLFSDLAGLVVNSATGRRMTSPINYGNYDKADARLQKLKDLQTQGRIGYERSLLSARMQDKAYDDSVEQAKAKAKAEVAAEQAKRGFEREKLLAQLHMKAVEGDRAAQQELERLNFDKDKLAETIRSNKAKEAIANTRANAYASKAIGSKDGSRGSSKEGFITLENGKEHVKISKSYFSGLAGTLYQMMKDQVSKELNTSGVKDVDKDPKMKDFQLAFDDVTNSAAIQATVQSRIKDFPELYEWAKERAKSYGEEQPSKNEKGAGYETSKELGRGY